MVVLLSLTALAIYAQAVFQRLKYGQIDDGCAISPQPSGEFVHTLKHGLCDGQRDLQLLTLLDVLWLSGLRCIGGSIRRGSNKVIGSALFLIGFVIVIAAILI